MKLPRRVHIDGDLLTFHFNPLRHPTPSSPFVSANTFHVCMRNRSCTVSPLASPRVLYCFAMRKEILTSISVRVILIKKMVNASLRFIVSNLCKDSNISLDAQHVGHCEPKTYLFLFGTKLNQKIRCNQRDFT